jgi:hypothetical protein
MKNLLPLIKNGLLLLFLLAGLNAFGQTNPCPINCTSSNDFFVADLYLGYPDGTRLPANYTCDPGDVEILHIWAVFGGSTSAGRYSLKLFYQVAFDGEILHTVNDCKFDKASIPVGIPVDFGAYNWSCGTSVSLENYYMAWQTAQNKGCGCNNKCYSPGFPLAVAAPLTADFTHTGNCGVGNFETITFTADVDGGTTPYTYSWNFGAGASPATGSSMTQAVSYSSGGDKTVTLTVTDADMTQRVVTKTVPVSGCCQLAVNCSAFSAQTRNTDLGKNYYTVMGTEFDPVVTKTYCGDVDLYNNKTGTGINTLAGAKFDIGVHNVTWTATNGTQTVTCTFTLTVVDNQAPVITCPTVGLTVNADNNLCTASKTFAATVTDNSGSATLVYKVSGNPITFPYAFPLGNTTVNVTASDAAGNTATCLFNVTVNDTQKPVVTCPTVAASYNADDGKCYAERTFTATATDNCGTPTIEYFLGATKISMPYKFPVGNTTVTAKATDAKGNFETCSFTVKVEDKQKPVPTCFVPLSSYPTVAGQNYATVTFASTATDNCGVASTKYYIGATEISSPYNFPLGTTTVKTVVTDVNGNSADCSFTINVSDAQGPILTCPTNVAASYETGKNAMNMDVCYRSLSFTATATDNDDPNPTITYKIGSATIGFPYNFPVGTTTVTVVATDKNNNSSTCSFNVKVVDVIKPVINCIANPQPIILLPPATHYTVVGQEFDPATFSDNCSVTIKNSFNNQATLAGAQLPAGTHEITWTATDASSNTATCKFTVTIFKGDCIEIGACGKTYIAELFPVKVRTTTVYRAYLNQDEIKQTLISKCGEPISNLNVVFSKTIFTPQDWGDQNFVTVWVTDQTGKTVHCEFNVIVRYPLSSGDMYAQGLGDQDFGSLDLDVQVFPNPTTGKLKVELWNLNDPRVSAVVYNTSGAVIMNREMTTDGQIEIDLTGNVSGLYLLRLVADKKEYLRKIILESR